MSTNLATINKEARLAMPAPEYSSEQVRILAETVAKGCDQNELGFFLNVCKLKRLDPFSGQVHCIKRWDSQLGREKMVVQVGIDGFRVNAARTEELAGSDDAVYDSEEAEHPNWAKVTVYRYGRNDERIPYTATARWNEYVQKKKDGTPSGKWVQMPFLMLGKCAEALALRKAFPDELSGMYTNEEMEQADSEGVTPASISKPPVSMPKSTDEKKAPAQTQQRESKEADTKTQSATTGSTHGGNSAATEPEKISGQISDVRHGKGSQEGSIFLIVEGKIVCIPKDLIDAEMVNGAKILVTAYRKENKNGATYLASAVEMCVPPAKEGEIIDAEFTDAPSAEQHNAEMKAVGDEIFGAAPQTAKNDAAPAQTAPAGETAKPGTIGVKRAKRLYAIISQNCKNSGFTEAELKRVMSALPVPIEHLRDLELGMYETLEKYATGEEDYNAFWKD